MSNQPVLVTGGSGFIAGHCILQLLDAGHTVRATIRSLAKQDAVRGVLREAGMTADDRLEFVAADLTRDDGWAEAVSGVGGVLHVASPVAPGHVENEDDVIVPARDGALRVLRAARDAGVGRVVLTSAFHAVAWGHPHDDHEFTEADWTVLEGPGVDAYGRSKTLSERAAWDFVQREGNGLQLVTMLPVAVMGPVLGRDVSGANHVVQRLLTRGLPFLPNIFMPIVDVRDVARAHLLALLAPDAAGQRFLLSDGPALSMREIAATIRSIGPAARRVPSVGLPDAVLRRAGRFNPEAASAVPDLGHARRASHAKATQLLGWTPRDAHEAIVAAARSMVDKGMIG